MLRSVLSSCSLLLVATLSGQLPTTQAFAVEYSLSGESAIVRNVKLLSGFHLDGYNNQPAFTPEGNLLLTTDRYGSQTEIIRLDLDQYTLERLTYSEESEYSPALNPSGKSITTVLVEADSTQTLIATSLQTYRTKDFTPSIDGLAYYRWVDRDRLVTVTLPAPMTLGMYYRAADSLASITDRVGRCLQVVGDGVYFTQLMGSKHVVKKYDMSTRSISTIASIPPGVQDFHFLQGDRLLIGDGPAVYLWNGQTFEPILDLEPWGLTHITRITSRRGVLVVINASEE